MQLIINTAGHNFLKTPKEPSMSIIWESKGDWENTQEITLRVWGVKYSIGEKLKLKKES